MKWAIAISFFLHSLTVNTSHYLGNLFPDYFNKTSLYKISSDIYHHTKYCLIPVSTDHFPALSLRIILEQLQGLDLTKTSNKEICQNFNLKYGINGYEGELRFYQVQYGRFENNTEYFEHAKNLAQFIKDLPETEREKIFSLKNPQMMQEISLINSQTEKWRKTVNYEYFSEKHYIRLKAWRKRIK